MGTKSDRKPDVEGYFRLKASTLLEELKYIGKLIPDMHHSLTVGEYYESCIARFIRDTVLPANCIVGRGFILDIEKKSISKQCDIIIYEPSYLRPIYMDGDFVIVDPVSVRFVIEVKAKIRNDKIDLNKIIDHGDSIKSIKYSPTGYALVSLFDDSLSDTTKRTLSEIPFLCSLKKGYRWKDREWHSDSNEVNNIIEFLKAIDYYLKHELARQKVDLFPEDNITKA